MVRQPDIDRLDGGIGQQLLIIAVGRAGADTARQLARLGDVREAMAAMCADGDCCNAGMTRAIAILAVPMMPQRTGCMLTPPPAKRRHPNA